MLDFKTLKWLFKKNTAAALTCICACLAFSIYINHQNIKQRLQHNNELISAHIKGHLEQEKERLKLLAQMLKMKKLQDIDLKAFTSIYYLDDFGNVLKRHSKDSNDQMNRFIQINSQSVAANEIFISRLVYSKSLKPSVYFAMRLSEQHQGIARQKEGINAKFLCARVQLEHLIDGAHGWGADYLISDSHENVLYSSAPKLIERGENFSNIGPAAAIFDLFRSDGAILAPLIRVNSGFYLRSFVASSELLNQYTLFSLILLIVLALFIYSTYLDTKGLKSGIVDQLNNCLDIFDPEKLKAGLARKTLVKSDVYALQLKSAQTVMALQKSQQNLKELSLRLDSMFTKSAIPMLMIDAFSAKICRANQAALEFYKMSRSSITQINLYTLSHKSGFKNDPINLACNMQNAIKNQGGFISSHHCIDGLFKDVKIYPFVMRSNNFCYDTLMVLQSDKITKELQNFQMRKNALEHSFISYLELELVGYKFYIKRASKGLSRALNNISLGGQQLRHLVHKHSIPQLANLLRRVKNLAYKGDFEQRIIYETTLFMRQNTGNYSEFRASFIIYFSDNLKISLSAELAKIRGDLSAFEVGDSIDYHNIYQNAKELIAVCDKDFNFLSTNAALRQIIGKEPSNLRAVLSEKTANVLDDFAAGSVASYAELIDQSGQIRSCKIKHINTKNKQDENIYAVYFQEDFYSPALVNFAVYMRSKGQDIEPYICEFYEAGAINPFIAQAGLAIINEHAGFAQLKALYTNALKQNL